MQKIGYVILLILSVSVLIYVNYLQLQLRLSETKEHAHWIMSKDPEKPENMHLMCSACEYVYIDTIENNKIILLGYCPCCGARMNSAPAEQIKMAAEIKEQYK